MNSYKYIIIVILFLFLSNNALTQDNNRKYMQAISWLVDSGTLVKRMLNAKANNLNEGVSKDQKDSSCYFEICKKIQYLGRPNLRKSSKTFIDSTIIKIPKEELTNSRIFYNKYNFQSYSLEFEGICKKAVDYKLILSRPVHNTLTVWLSPTYSVINCTKPKFGTSVTITFIYNDNDEILDYAISSIIIN